MQYSLIGLCNCCLQSEDREDWHKCGFLIFQVHILKHWKQKEYIKETKFADTAKHPNNMDLDSTYNNKISFQLCILHLLAINTILI